MEVVDSEERSSSEGLKSIPIGNTASGHGPGKKCSFVSWQWAMVMAAFFINSLPGFLSNVLRVSTNYTGPVVILGRIVKIVCPFLLGWVHDSMLLQPIFNKLGCKYNEWGRRAPHVIYGALMCAILVFFVYRPSNFANMATEVITTGNEKATLIDYNITQYIVGKDNDILLPYPKKGFMDSANGLDCTKSLRLLDANGIWHNFTATRTVGARVKTVVPVYSTQICSGLVSTFSVCWPGPKGNPVKVGDGGPRLCSFMDGPTLFVHALILALFSHIAIQTMWQASQAAKFEVYPWKEERVDLLKYNPLASGLALITFQITYSFIGQRSEFGTGFTGAINFRKTVVGIIAVTCLVSMLSAWPMKDAKQVDLKKDQFTGKNIFAEYRAIFCDEGTIYYRYFLIVNSITRIMVSFVINSTLFYLLHVMGIPLSDFAGAVIGMVLPPLLINGIAMLFLANYIFATKPKNGQEREHTRNPRKAALICVAIELILVIIVWPILGSPFSREELKAGGGKNFVPLIPYQIITGLLGLPYIIWVSSAYGWAIDYDNHSRRGKGNKRRESLLRGLYAGLDALTSLIGVTFSQGLRMGTNPLCDTRLAPEDQTQACIDTFFWLWYIFAIILLIIAFVFCYFFPIKGKLMEDIIKIQKEYQLAVEGTDAYKARLKDTAAAGGGGGQSGSGAAYINTSAPVKIVSQPVVVPKTMKVRLPDSVTAGMELEYPLSDGRKVKVVVKEGEKGGDMVAVDLP